MPNTLAHFGVHHLATRLGQRAGGSTWQVSDLLWIWTGAVLPDVPWLLQRIAHFFVHGEARYDLRLYFVVQASLLFCLVLAAAVALLAEKPQRAAAILSLGAVIHLLLDACQIKWANGVLLFAPFDWRLLRFDLFWPESLLTWLLVAGGVVSGVLAAPALWQNPIGLVPRRWPVVLPLLAVWVFLPIALLRQAESGDVHFVGTLRNHDQRPGRQLELYNAHWFPGLAANETAQGEGAVVTMSEERLIVTTGEAGIALPAEAARMSIKGHFETSGRLRLEDFHVHRARQRDALSLPPLAALALLWLRAVLLANRRG